MVGFVLTGHGDLAPGLTSALAMVAGELPAFAQVPFTDETAGSFGEPLAVAMADLAAETDGLIVFTDLLGGTPFNQAMLASVEVPDVDVVTGANLPMLLECLVARGQGATRAELVATAVSVGKAGIANKSVADLLAPPTGADAAPAEGI